MLIKRICNKLSYLYSKHILRHIYNVRYRNYGFRCEGVLMNCQLNIQGAGHKIHIGKGCVLRNTRIEIAGENHTFVIGENTKFYDSGRIRMGDSHGVISIGRNLAVSDIFLTTADVNNKITIGDDCLISAKVIVRGSDGHSIIDDSTGRRINPAKDVTIGDRVWIGYGVTILKGSVIGDDSVIGTNALVSGNIPAHSVAVGFPAKVIKENISWKEERIKS